ncbi:MAG TPA: PAS domain S-box protein, partial [Terriglobales bacterium]|nr:PAS domain S-box protein [Terriglobales bacterium]
MSEKHQAGERARHSMAGPSTEAAAAAVSHQPVTASSETRYRRSFERNPVGLYRTNLQGKILDCNDACARIFGYARREELLAHSATEHYLDPADRTRSLDVLRRDHVLKNLEVLLRKRDGGTVWVLENAILLEEEVGQGAVIEGTLIDISDLKQSDERFQIEKAHLEQLFENSPEAIATLDNHFRIKRINSDFTRIFGYTPEEALGHELNDLITPIDKLSESIKLSETLASGQTINTETVRRRKDGTFVDVSILGTPVISATGEQIGMYAIYREITERKQAERLQSALYRIADKANSAVDLPELYRSIHAILNELMYAKNCYIAVYDPVTDMVSFPYFVDEKDPVYPTAMPHKFRKGLTEYVLRTGEPLLATPEKLDELVKAGELERAGSPSLDWMGVPLKIGEKIVGTLVVQSYRENVRYGEHEKGILVFVSQQIASAIENRRILDAIRESENKFRAMAETAVTAISIYDDQRFLYVNPAAANIFGFTAEEMLRFSPTSLVHPDYAALTEARGKARLAGEPVPSRYEFQVLTRSGEARWLDFSARAIQFEGRNAMVATAVDITERKRAELLQSALYRIAEKTSAAGDLSEFYAYIHQVVGELMHAENFYIALYDQPTNTLSFPYFVDEQDIRPVRKVLGRGLTENVLRTGRPLLATPAVFEEMVRTGEVESIGAPSLDWLGVPLVISDKPIGVLVVQTYRENIRYGEPEKDILTFVSR